jgi:cytochrome c
MLGLDAQEINKIAGVTLGVCILTFAINALGNAVFPRSAPAHAAAAGAGAPTAHGAAPEAPPAAAEPIGKRLAGADPKAGESAFKKACASCHTIEAGGAAKTGPNLRNVVGRPVGSAAGFAYSDALKSHGGPWSYELLDQWIASPKAAIPGNKMAFGGEKNPSARADIVAYLASQTENPPSPPQP